MGMDVSGINPTTEAGKYFRANVWSWRPLASLIRLVEFVARWTADHQGLVGDARQSVHADPGAVRHMVVDNPVRTSAPAYFDNKQFELLGSNDGAGTRTAAATQAFARSFEHWLRALKNRDEELMALFRGLGLCVLDEGDEPALSFVIGKKPEPYESLIDTTGRFRKRGEIPLDDLRSAYSTRFSHLDEWVEFLKGAGDGFEIW